MLVLRRLGALVRESRQAWPLERLRARVASYGAELIELGSADAPDRLPRVDPPVDLVVALGGDGTVLRALCEFPDIPVVGINFGHLGFLTAADENDLDRRIDDLFRGKYTVEQRLVLRTQYKNQTYLAINELVVKAMTKMVAVDVHVDGHFLHTYRGDGVILGTPTGSTSYLMSTGSSIVMPTVDCFILNGINEHRFSSRGLVLNGNSRIHLRINPATRDPEPFLAHDGRDRIALRPGDEIDVARMDTPSRLIFFERNYFFTNLKSRLNW